MAMFNDLWFQGMEVKKKEKGDRTPKRQELTCKQCLGVQGEEGFDRRRRFLQGEEGFDRTDTMLEGLRAG